MENLGNNPPAEVPQTPPQFNPNNQYAQVPPGAQYPPQYAQAPQYAQKSQYPQYPQGQYGTGRNLPPKKKSVWPKVLLVGCGCLGGIALVLLGFLAIVGITMCNEKDPLDTTLMLEELNIKDKKAVDGNIKLTGTVAGASVVMYLNNDEGDITGYYYYTKMGPNNALKLSGTLYDDDSIELEEYNSRNGVNSGSFSGYLVDGHMSGDFYNSKGNHYTFNLYVAD